VSNIAFRCERTPAFFWRQPFICDEAWALIAPLFPPSLTTGRPRKWALRLLLEAMLYLLRTGCQWRALPDAFPPYSTVQRHFYAWRDAGLFERINHLLVMLDREREGTRGVSSGRRHRQPVGQDQRNRWNKRVRRRQEAHGIEAPHPRRRRRTAARRQHVDRRYARFSRRRPVLPASRWPWLFIERFFADASYRGKRIATATSITVEIVTGPPNQRGFIVQNDVGRGAHVCLDRAKSPSRQRL
jgi:transposase